MSTHRIPRLLWWLGIAYAVCLSLYPYLIGCDCSHAGHTCGIVQYYACIGAVLWMLLVPVGLWLYRRAENISILFMILLCIQLLCTMVLLYTPLAGLHDPHGADAAPCPLCGAGYGHRWGDRADGDVPLPPRCRCLWGVSVSAGAPEVKSNKLFLDKPTGMWYSL